MQNIKVRCFNKLIGFCRYHLTTRKYSESVTMAYTMYGSSASNKLPPVIIMHAILSCKENWAEIAKSLKSSLNTAIYAVDARNHGESPHSNKHSSNHMAIDVEQFTRTMSIQKTNILGDGMGGRTMMYFALKYPNLVNKGVIVDFSPITVPQDMFSIEKLLLALQNISIPSNLSLKQGQDLVKERIGSIISSTMLHLVLINLRKKGQTGDFYWSPNIQILKENLREFDNFLENIKSLPPFQGSMLFLCGNDSYYIIPDYWSHIKIYFPNCELFWFDGDLSNHSYMFVDIVTKFFQK